MKEKYLKLKKGERVRVYQEMAPVVGVVTEAGEIHPSYLSVEVGGKIIRPQRKQCRRLVPKKRREWWALLLNEKEFCNIGYGEPDHHKNREISGSQFAVLRAKEALEEVNPNESYRVVRLREVE